MEDQIKTCKKCQEEYSFLSTETDLCAECVEKYPYFLSFIEEGGMGVMNRTFGRVEVHSNKGESEYAIDEIRFLFKDNQHNTSRKIKEFRKFSDRWDFQNVTSKELEEVKQTIKERFYDLSAIR